MLIDCNNAFNNWASNFKSVLDRSGHVIIKLESILN